LLFSKNWQEKLKWVCFLLIVFNFTFDQISAYLSKIPQASGRILRISDNPNRHLAQLEVSEGVLHEGQFIKGDKFAGIIVGVDKQSSESEKIVWVEVDSATQLKAPSSFKVLSTLRIANIALIIELIFTFLIFHFSFANKPFWRIAPLIACIISLIWWIFRNIALNKIHTYGAAFIGGTTLLIILFALIFFYFQLSNPNNLFISSSPSFWIVSGILLYKTGTFFLFLYVNSLNQNAKANFYIINSIFYLLESVLFTIGFLTKKNDSTKLAGIFISK
jgi:hypothetical protein